MRKADKMVRIGMRGDLAVMAAMAGAKMYVLNPQLGWVPADAPCVARAARLLGSHATWIYGVA